VWIGPWEGPGTRWVEARAPPPKESATASPAMAMAGVRAAIDRMRRIVGDPFTYSAAPYGGDFDVQRHAAWR